MKKNSKKSRKNSISEKLQKFYRAKMSKIHVLIAVVAIIECLILISFTTFSWIETASSLIIKTGKKYNTDTTDSRIPIASAVNNKFIIANNEASDSDCAQLDSFFDYSGESQTQNLYRFAKASSYNGKDFYFKKTSSTYRAGDIIDSNTNYAHFDFVVSNTATAAKNNKYKFYFKDNNVFTVTNGTGTLNTTQLNYVKNAMRISFQTGTGTPKIYSPAAANYNAISSADGDTTAVSTTAIGNNDDNQKLFTVGKNSEQKISVRIWLESQAPGISALTQAQLASVNIGISLHLTYANNNKDFMYFDDYTFSSGIKNKDNIGGHLTGDYSESDDHRMYFVYQTSSGGDDRHVYPMTIDYNSPNTDALCWVTCDANGTPSAEVHDIPDTQPYITNLTTANHNALQYSYFAYGEWDITKVGTTDAPATPDYKWYLNGSPASDEDELRFSGYSVTYTDSGAANANGVGGWAYNTPLSMIYFRDLATAVTSNSYNTGSTTYVVNNTTYDYYPGTSSNFRYITNAVNAASDNASGNRNNVMYCSTTDATGANKTVTLYFDKSAENGKGIFKSWVPDNQESGGVSWITNKNLKFSYCPGGYYANVAIYWTNSAAASKPALVNNYVYTALGYTTNAAVVSGSNYAGVGTWREIESEPVNFSTELIDNVAAATHHYQIGVKIEGSNSYSYYTLVPDSTNMKFYAYIPKAGTNVSPSNDYEAGGITFQRFSAVGAGESVSATWYCNQRKGSDTYYPIAANTTAATSGAPKGYWNISIIVDGTYEHFFWVPDAYVGTPPQLVSAHVLGTFLYNTVGHEGSPTYYNITLNVLDEYRWYVPLDGLDTIPEFIFYKWEPYTGTTFLYSQKLSDGIYCVITEAPDNTPSNAFS